MSETFVERKYSDHLREMSGQRRLERALSLYDSIHEMLALQISRQFPGLSERTIRIKIAERFYASDRRAKELLKGLS